MAITVQPETKATLLPEAINEIYQGVNALARTFRKGCEGIEKTVDGAIEITSIMLAQQRTRLLEELA